MIPFNLDPTMAKSMTETVMFSRFPIYNQIVATSYTDKLLYYMCQLKGKVKGNNNIPQ